MTVKIFKKLVFQIVELDHSILSNEALFVYMPKAEVFIS